MAFKRTSFSALKSQKKEYFESIYKFSKKVPNFKPGDDVYVIPLGLEGGFFETPCHRVMPHKVDGQTIGFGGSGYAVYIKCNGVNEDGERNEGALCCQLAKKERERQKSDFKFQRIGRFFRIKKGALQLSKKNRFAKLMQSKRNLKEKSDRMIQKTSVLSE